MRVSVAAFLGGNAAADGDDASAAVLKTVMLDVETQTQDAKAIYEGFRK